MKLRALALNQFKKFTSPVRLGGIDDGLNVVVGPNEMGKSTLLDALRAALFEKYSSKAQPIAALQNDRNQAGPVVELAFEMDDGPYVITKRFIKKPYARLSCPDGRMLEGDAAEDTLRGLLGFDEPGKTGAKPESIGMWNVLWVQQGHSFGALDLPETARSSLHSALESEVGEVLGGRRGRALPQAIEKQLGELVVSSGRPRGVFKDAIDRRDVLQADLEGLRTRRTELSQTLDDLDEAQDTLSRLSSTDRDKDDQAELDGARTRHSQLAALEARIEAAATELQLKRRNLEQAEQAQAVRNKHREDIAADEWAMKAARDRLDEVSEQEKDARKKYDGVQEAVRAAEAAVTKVDAAVTSKRRILSAVERDARTRALQDQLAKAQGAEKRQHEAQQGAAAILMTDKAIQGVRVAAKAVETVGGRLNAAATTITFEMSADSLAGIEIDGKPLTGDRPTVQAVEPAGITIPGRGRIIIDPAIKDRDKLIAQQRDTTVTLKTALDVAGAAGIEDAEDQYAKRQALLQDAALARQEAALHAPATDDYEAGAAPLADYIEGLRKILARDKDELGLKELPSRQEAETALNTAENRAGQARHDVDTARAQLAGPGDTLERLKTQLTAARTRHDDAGMQLKKRQEEGRKAEQACPEAKLQADVDAARAAANTQEQAVSALEGQRTDETLPQLGARIERLDKAIRDRRQKRETLNVRIAGLKSRIEALEGAGLDEAIERKNRERELCDEECGHFEREAAILTLLLSTLRAAEHDAKERYLSPVLKRVRPYLQLLFPGAEITIDENLRVTGVVREAGYEEAFHHLSMGTQEQIAVLVRLAFAEMLVEQGHPATVILDDALVFSDDRRMSRMFDILNMAARNVQVIVLTCREQLFEGLGGRQLTLQAGSSEELISA
jgi:energy-coupling factor transporter ATP-binding protein EcfA2